MNEQSSELQAVGLAMLGNGFSIIPIDRKTKKPKYSELPFLNDEQGQPVMKQHTDTSTGEIHTFHGRGWKDYQTTRASAVDLRKWVGRGAQLAVVCGQVSGGLLIIDFDMYAGKTKNLYEEWVAACEERDLEVSLLPTQRTGSGGYQVAVRCQNPGENTKLCWVEDASEERGRKVAIETRGTGGYAVIAPSLHPSGNQYRMIHGQFFETPLVNQAEVEMLLDVARSLNQVPERAVEYVPTERRADAPEGSGVIDAYNSAFDIRAVLRAYGYSDAGDRMHRPGFERTSEPSVVFKENKSFHHSSNDDLSNGYWQTPFSVRLHFGFDGDVLTAVKEIAAELGMTRTGREAVIVGGLACCPDHPSRALRPGKSGGYFCPQRVLGSSSGFCGFYWKGDGYTPPPPISLTDARKSYKSQSSNYAHVAQ